MMTRPFLYMVIGFLSGVAIVALAVFGFFVMTYWPGVLR